MKPKGAIVTGALIVAIAMPLAASAGSNGGKMKQQCLQSQTQAGNQIQKRGRDRLRDGSCLDGTQMRSGAVDKRGNAYGPGDGTGYGGTGPKDGTGYGAPGSR